MNRYDATAYRSVFDTQFTFVNGFWRNVGRYADRPALVETADGRSWTYAELGRDVARLAAGLRGHGVRPQDVVTFALYNSAEFALTYLAAEHLGAIASPINFRFSPGEIAHVLSDSRPRALVVDADLAETVRVALGLTDHRPDLLVLVEGASARLSGKVVATPDLGAMAFENLLGTEELWQRPDGNAWEESVRLYTSGTTGMPKGVSLPAAAEVLTAHDVIMHFPLDPTDRTLNMTPWFHRGGISPGGPNAIFYAGASGVTMRQFDADRCLDLVAEQGLTFLIGAPTNLALLADAQERRPRDLGTLRGLVTMGAPLEREPCLRYQRVLTERIFNGYGTTEAFWNTFLRPTDLPAHAGTAGRSCTDDDVRVVAVYDDHPAEPDDLVAKDGSTTGEVIMRSLKSGYSYHHQPAEQAAKFRSGWLYSGDLGTWDADEFVRVVGRKDDIIISGGENVHPVQVEEVLNEHEAVVDSIVVGLPDERWGELVVAYVQARDPVPSAAELDRHCRTHPMLADFKRPRAYRFVGGLPRTATGKKMHYVIRDELRSGPVDLVRP